MLLLFCLGLSGWRKDTVQRVIPAGWKQEGHPATKCLHHFPLSTMAGKDNNNSNNLYLCFYVFTAIILTPTRELAMQIGRECRKFTKTLDLHVVCVYGGTGISEQIAELKRGAEVIVCTPGRMIDMLAANSGTDHIVPLCVQSRDM